jgi:hypothetical protein
MSEHDAARVDEGSKTSAHDHGTLPTAARVLTGIQRTRPTAVSMQVIAPYLVGRAESLAGAIFAEGSSWLDLGDSRATAALRSASPLVRGVRLKPRRDYSAPS